MAAAARGLRELFVDVEIERFGVLVKEREENGQREVLAVLFRHVGESQCTKPVEPRGDHAK